MAFICKSVAYVAIVLNGARVYPVRRIFMGSGLLLGHIELYRFAYANTVLF
ncbi:hypothetical protein D3C81_1378830 [compost metagenome]